MPAAYFVVRATVSDPAKRAAFDRWYSKEHLPDAAKSFGVEKAWRFWSISDPSLHQATYQFADQAALDRAMNGEDLKRLVADFNRDWPDITRTRELLVKRWRGRRNRLLALASSELRSTGGFRYRHSGAACKAEPGIQRL